MSVRANSPLVKAHYRPIDAAIRWSGLLEYEQKILRVFRAQKIVLPGDFPQWPHFQTKLERIYDGLADGSLRFELNGAPKARGAPFYDSRVTIHHFDLKRWLRHHYPDEQPDFLFGSAAQASLKTDDLETSGPPRGVRSEVRTLDELQALARRCEALNTTLNQREQELWRLRQENERLLRQRAKAMDSDEQPSIADTNLMRIFIEKTFGSSPSGKPNSRFRSRAEWIDEVVGESGHLHGISKRTIERKFAALTDKGNKI